MAEQDDGGHTFWIDQYGRPVFTSDNTIGFPMPYYQQLIFGDTAVQRCYIMPFTVNEWCVRWLRDTTKPVVSAHYWPLYTHAVAASTQYTLSSENFSDKPTKTAAPPTTTGTGAVGATTVASAAPTEASPGQSQDQGQGQGQGGKNSAPTAAPGVAGVVAVFAVVAVYHNL